MLRFSKTFLFLLFLAFALRLSVTWWSLNFRENSDVLRYKDWARIAYLYGFADTYKTDHLTFGTLPNNQPPGSLFMLYPAYITELQVAKIYGKITKTKPGANLWINGPLLNIFLRLPSIIADILLGIFLYILVKKKKSESAGLLAASFFLFNPVILYNSAFWGQMDALNNLAFFIAIYFLIEKKLFWAVLFYCFSLYIKMSLLPALPVFLLLLFIQKSKNRAKLIFSFIGSFSIIFFLTFFIAKNPVLWLWNFLIHNAAGEMQNITNFACNFWWFVVHPTIKIGKATNLFSFSQVSLIHMPSLAYTFLGLRVHVWGYLLFFLSITPFLIFLYFRKNHEVTPARIALILSLTMLFAFLFLPTMHERYMYPAFPLLALSIGLQNKYKLIYILLSLLNLINLYIVWHPMMFSFFPYALMSNWIFQWFISCAVVIVSVYFYIRSFTAIIAHE